MGKPYIDNVLLDYEYLKKELAIADIVKKSKKHPVIMPNELRRGAQSLASSMLGYWNNVGSDGDARVIAKDAFNIMAKKMNSAKVRLADFNKYWNAVSPNKNKNFKINMDTEAVTEPKISKKSMVMKDKTLQSFSFKRNKDTGYLVYEMINGKAVFYSEKKETQREEQVPDLKVTYKKNFNKKNSKQDTRQAIVVANKALRFKTTKLEYKRTIQYADAKKVDAIKKKKKVKQVTQYYKKDSTYKIKSPYVLKKGYQLKGFSLRKSKKGKVYKDKGKLPWGCGTAIQLHPIVVKKKKKKKG